MIDIMERIAHLQMERVDAIEKLREYDADLREIKARLANAQNIAHQTRLDKLHRVKLRQRALQETEISRINTRISLLHAQRQRGLREAGQNNEVA